MTLDAVPVDENYTQGPGHIAIRPERLKIQKGSLQGNLSGRVSELIYLGTDTQVIVNSEDASEITIRVQNAHETKVDLSVGEIVHLIPDAGAVRLLTD